MLAPARGLGLRPAGVRLVHVPVAGFHSHISWVAAPNWLLAVAPDQPPNMTSRLRVSSKAAACK